MKKLTLVLVMGLCGTVVFAQDAQTAIAKDQVDVKVQSGAKLKNKLDVKETKHDDGLQQSMVAKKKMKAHKMQLAKPLMLPAKVEK